MNTESRRRAFALKELLAVIGIVAVLLAISLPAVQASRSTSRRNQCSNKLKQIGLALQNHHDVFKRFPALTNQGRPDGSANVRSTAPGATFSPGSPAPNGYTQSPANAAGYCWLVMILPYLEETVLYNTLSAASNKFECEAFSTTSPNGSPFSVTLSGAPRHFSTIALDEVQCPAFAGDAISTASSGTAQPPVSIPAYAALFSGSVRPPTGIVITNYVALSATHLACMALGPTDSKTDKAEPPNGVIVPGFGLNMKAVLDGTSKTILLCETKEPAVNSWYDGTVCWTVGANPSATNQPTCSSSAIGKNGSANSSGFWIFPKETMRACGLNYGPASNKTTFFAPNGTTLAQTAPVSWGPSSDHADGVVMHLACDGSIHAITTDIDPDLYLELITRAGREPVTLPDVCSTERRPPVVAIGDANSSTGTVR